MKKIALSIALLSLNILLFSQTAILTSHLNQELNNGKNSDYFKVNIVFVDQVNHIVLNQNLKQTKVSAEERAKTVIRKSMDLANQTQANVVNLLNSNSNRVKSYKSYWIINMMVIEAKKDVIMQLAGLPEIDYMEEFDHFTGKPIEIMKGITAAEKSVGGIEPGLAAINAPALWSMGYTGKARKYFSIDTGVWKDHPAISDNWLGNYQPMNQALYGIDSPVPIDKSGSHGTHTVGTVLGLEQATNDTIGVAFNAYFMVSDPIVTNIADIKPLPDYIDVFEFALNPDGDTATTSDIPDAINNSWGIDEHHDTSICSGYVTQMFDAIETAGIANVFSAGNEGPSDTTIGKPQYVSTGLVNTFTVGAVNGASPSFPITNFSSHGPTACPTGGGSLEIKPEVVAPGLNVRSSIDQNNYASFNGTSMAGPHATGAVLILKEAFPNATGEEILLALYNSAIDLGVVGEDNTYGKGMIDVLAAFNLLALSYTPTPPNQYKYDIAVKSILNPSNDIICNQSISPKILIENKGDSAITNATITYQLNNELVNNYNWIGVLLPGDTVSINLPVVSALAIGNYELKIKAEIDSLNIECDYINNQRVSRFRILDYFSTLPYSEDFENMRIDSSEWFVRNPDGSTTWDTIPTAGLPSGNYSATMQLYNYPGSKQLDDLISTQISLPLQDSLFLRFDLAYQMIVTAIADTLTISISEDCGDSFTEIYKKGGEDLETNDTLTSNFVPKYSSHWRREYVDITAHAGNDVIIQFQSYNKSGNNLYLDNIWVYEGAEPVSTKEYNIEAFKIYPNPTSNIINIDLAENEFNKSTIEVIDLLGKTIKSFNVHNKLVTIDMNSYSTGIYFIKFTNQLGSKTQKIIKQ
jgi:subtilisin family serine protease